MGTKSEILVSSSKSVIYQLRDTAYNLYVRRRYASVTHRTRRARSFNGPYMDKNVSTSKYSI